jgi:phytoene desaturase (3,4-didehydrolycopene-forming)
MSTASRQHAEASWKVLRDTGEEEAHNLPFTSVDQPFNFYVHRATKTDSSAAPAGMDSILVLVPCKTLQRIEGFASLPREEAIQRYKEQFNKDFIDRAREAVLHRFSAVESLQNIRSLILDEVVDTPATYADQYNVGAGTPFALSHGFSQLSLTRPGPASSGLSNVLFCGASTRPGNGVPLVALGAKLIAEKAVSKLRDRIRA